MKLRKGLEEILRERAFAASDQPYSVISLHDCREAAEIVGVSAIEAEIAALNIGICPMRYERNMGTIGIEGQIKLLCSSVAVVGLGGLGGLITELLARVGVGHMILVDGDSFSESNINRQLLCAESDIGRSKAETAGARAAAINGAVRVRAVNSYIDNSNVAAILEGSDLVMDALDSRSARVIVSDYCRAVQLPFIHGAIGGMWAQVGIFMPGERRVWETFSEYDEKGEESPMGNPPFTASLCASLETALAVAVICGRSVESGVLHWCDLNEISLKSLPL